MSKDAIIEDIKKAVELYELENQNVIRAFHEKAIEIYNYIATHPQLLKTIEPTYIVGVFYSYVEGALRDTDLSTIPVENAFYCFAKTIENDMSDWNEKQCAAVRLFILMCNNGCDTERIIGKVLKKNCTILAGCAYHELAIEKIIFLKDAIKHGIMAHCYSVFNNDINKSFLSNSQMNMLRYHVARVNNGNVPLSETMGEHSNVYYFNLWYDYLRKVIEFPQNTTVSRSKTIFRHTFAFPFWFCRKRRTSSGK